MIMKHFHFGNDFGGGGVVVRDSCNSIIMIQYFIPIILTAIFFGVLIFYL